MTSQGHLKWRPLVTGAGICISAARGPAVIKVNNKMASSIMAVVTEQPRKRKREREMKKKNNIYDRNLLRRDRLFLWQQRNKVNFLEGAQRQIIVAFCR